MALPTGGGTETLHSHMFKDLDGTTALIYGVQHHVYTVLSIIVYCKVLNATTDVFNLRMRGHEAHGGTAGTYVQFATANIQVGETFVWNDKYSFNGVEPTGTAILSAAEQIAIAGQTGSNVQELQMTMTSAVDDYDVIVTYIDQDNS